MGKITISILFLLFTATSFCACDDNPKTKRTVKAYEGRDSLPVSKTVPGAEDEREAGMPPEVVDVDYKPEKPTTKDTIKIKPKVEADNPSVVSYLYDWKVNGESTGQMQNRLSGEYFGKDDTVVAVITPSDENGEGENYEFEITIENTPPQITSRPPSGNIVDRYTYQVVVRDPDSDDITYSITDEPSGMTIDSATGLIEWPINPSITGNYAIKIEVTDTSGDGASQTFDLNFGE
jgi:Putative Ig domain